MKILNKEETLYNTEFLALKKMTIRDTELDTEFPYFYFHEINCHGKKVAFLPFRKKNCGRYEYLLRKEVIPCWGLEPQLSAITGGCNDRDPVQTAVAELLEESGYTIVTDELIPLGNSRANKSSDTLYFLYSVDLSEKQQDIIKCDGSPLEEGATCVWMKEPVSDDPLVALLFLRLQPHRNRMNQK